MEGLSFISSLGRLSYRSSIACERERENILLELDEVERERERESSDLYDVSLTDVVEGQEVHTLSLNTLVLWEYTT